MRDGASGGGQARRKDTEESFPAATGTLACARGTSAQSTSPIRAITG